MQVEYAVQCLLLMYLHNIHFMSLKEGAVVLWAFEGKVISLVQRNCYILLVGGWRKMAHLLPSTCLHKPCQRFFKNGEMFHVSCLFLPKAKKGGQKKVEKDTVTYQGRMWQG